MVWVCYVEEKSKTVKTVMEVNVEERRRRRRNGISKKKLLDAIESDIITVGVCTDNVEDSIRWRFRDMGCQLEMAGKEAKKKKSS